MQSLFFFDPIAIYVPLFSLFSFATYTYYVKDREPQSEDTRSNGFSPLIKLGSVALGVLLVASFIWTSIIPMYQMRTMLNAFNSGRLDVDDVRKMTTPDNFIQSEVRLFALFNAIDKLPKEDTVDVIPQMIDLGEAALERSSNRARR